MAEIRSESSSSFSRAVLPWIVAAGSLVVFLVTLHPWVTFSSLSIVAKVTGWNWAGTLSYPVLHVTTLPMRVLPESMQLWALNAFAAVCAALTLALLARSVALLPQNRTRDQRQRERNEHGLLTGPWAWVPVLLAVGTCALQLSFWERATAVTGEMLNLLMFAYVIRCLLEFRVSGKDSWLYRLALVYGLAVTNNYALIGFFPLALVALVWIKGLKFFEFRFLSRMLGWGGLGLSFYLLIPLIEQLAGHSEATFWQLLKAQLATQKNLLLFGPLRNRVLVLSFTSIVPVLFMGIRWPSRFGDMSAAGSAITNLMFRLVHALFLVACIFVAFDPAYSPRNLGLGLPFLTFYYLGALSIGYFSGYFLVVAGKEPEKKWRRISTGEKLLGRATVGLLILSVALVPAGLVWKNGADIQANKSGVLKEFALQHLEGIPDEPAVILSDDLSLLLLAQAAHADSSREHQPIFINTQGMKWQVYLDALKRQHGEVWPELDLSDAFHPYDSMTKLKVLNALNEKLPMYYLEHSFGEFFEMYYQVPMGMASRFVMYTPEQFRVPPMPAEALDVALQFWTENPVWDDPRFLDDPKGDAQYLGSYYSRALNHFGVVLQRSGRGELAGEFFQHALAINEDNLAAAINSLYHEQRVRGESGNLQMPQDLQSRLQDYRNNWRFMMQENGPWDEPSFCFGLGNVFRKGHLDRQSAQQYARALELNPQHLDAGLRLADVYLNRKVFDEVIALVQQLNTDLEGNLSVAHRLQLIRFDAWARYYRGEVETAMRSLREAYDAYPDFPEQLHALARMYVQQEDIPKALAAVEELLQRLPNHAETLMLKSNIHLAAESPNEALTCLNRVLEMTPNDTAALARRAYVHYQMQDLEAAVRDYELLREAVPDYNLVNFQLAQIAEAQGEIDQAISLYREFLEKEPEGSRARATVQEKLNTLKETP